METYRDADATKQPRFKTVRDHLGHQLRQVDLLKFSISK